MGGGPGSGTGGVESMVIRAGKGRKRRGGKSFSKVNPNEDRQTNARCESQGGNSKNKHRKGANFKIERQHRRRREEEKSYGASPLGTVEGTQFTRKTYLQRKKKKLKKLKKGSQKMLTG